MRPFVPSTLLIFLTAAPLAAAADAPRAAAVPSPATLPTGPALKAILEQPGNRFGQADVCPWARPPAYINGRFDIKANEVIVFAGQTNTVRAQQSGDLEARLAVGFADRQPRFRSMAWEGDTVYQQWRDLNFGGWSDQLHWSRATAVICAFGQTEALDGPSRLDAFAEAYGRLLDAMPPRAVLVSPMPFEKPTSPLLPDHTCRNEDVRAYAEAVRALASKRGFVFVDLFTPLVKRSAEPHLTSNGIHLTSDGHRIVGRLIAERLGVKPIPDDRLEPVRQAVVKKNQLWFDNWRPMNWAFAYGDRQQVPFSKPAGGRPALRIEFEEFKPLVGKADQAIHEASSRAAAAE